MESAPNREQSTSVWHGKYCEITEENVESCYTAAVLHNEEDKKEACIKFISANLRADNCIRFLNSAIETIRDEGFLATVRDYVLRHIEEVKSRLEFLNLTAGTIDTLLVPITRNDEEEQQQLDFSPTELFMSLYEWMSEKRPQRMIKFDEILEKFPMELVDLDLLEKVFSDEELQSYPKILRKFLDAVVKKYRKDMQQRKSKSISGAEIGEQMNHSSGSEDLDAASTLRASDNERDVIEIEESFSELTVDTDRSVAAGGSTRSFVSVTPECDVIIVDEYCPSEWMSEVMPKVHPYFPQVGDDLVYFRQGHERYMQRVMKTRAYPVTGDTIGSLPYRQDPYLPPEMSVKLTNITFKNYSPPRVAILTLERMGWDSGKPMGFGFQVSYHDLPNVTDFLVLRQVYDYALKRRWRSGDRFKSLRGNTWRTGKITEANFPYQSSFTDSHYLSFLVAWDDHGICQRGEPLSPWEVHPIKNDLRMRAKFHPEVNNGTRVSREELLAIMREIFPRKLERQDKESRRISSLLDFILKLPTASRFLAPHAPNFDDHLIDYPRNLSIIKARLDNGFYRRNQAILTDCDQIALNASASRSPPDELSAKLAKVFGQLIREIVSDVRMTQESLEKRYNNLCRPDLGGTNAVGVSKGRRYGNPVPETLLALTATNSRKYFNRVNNRIGRGTQRAQLSPVDNFNKSVITSQSLSKIRHPHKLKGAKKVVGTKRAVVSSKPKKNFGSALHFCAYCDYQHIRRDKVKQHERNNHTGEKPYSCPYCLKSFPSWTSLYNHRKICNARKNVLD